MSTQIVGNDVNVQKTWKTLFCFKNTFDSMTGEELNQDLLKKGRVSAPISDCIVRLISLPVGDKNDIQVVAVGVKELGLKSCACLSDIYKQAKHIGLNLFTLELALLAALRYESRYMEESFFFGMHPFSEGDENKYLFYINDSKQGYRQLSTRRANPTDIWFPEDIFLFFMNN